MRVALRSGEPFAFAGIWSVWKDPEDNSIPTCAIITTSANELLRLIHHRMPAILPREMEGFWLDRSIQDTTELRSVLTPYPDAAMEAYEDEAGQARTPPRPPFTFPGLGIPEGAEIHFTGGDAAATVAGPRTVAYEGREYRLTPLTKKLRGTGKRVTATYYWKYRGATLHSILEGLPREDAE